MQWGIWREIKRREWMVLYYTVCVCGGARGCTDCASILFKVYFLLIFLLCCCQSVFFVLVLVGLWKRKRCVCRHKQSRINCTEEEKCPTCAVGGKLAQGQLMYRLSICTYFIPGLENKSCLCLGLFFPSRCNKLLQLRLRGKRGSFLWVFEFYVEVTDLIPQSK